MWTKNQDKLDEIAGKEGKNWSAYEHEITVISSRGEMHTRALSSIFCHHYSAQVDFSWAIRS